METTESWQDTKDMAERRRIQNRIAQRAYRARVKNKMKQSSSNESKHESTSTTLVPRTTEANQFNFVVNRSMLNDSQFIFLQSTSYAKAFGDNAARIGVSHAALCSDDGLSPFFETTIASDSMMDLVPTSLQRALPHHPFFDVLPFPRMRDLAMSALSMEMFDEDEFITDVGQNFYCWGREPALESSWKMSPEFIKKWWFMVDKDMLKQTNFWRQNRGLPRITQEQCQDRCGYNVAYLGDSSLAVFSCIRFTFAEFVKSDQNIGEQFAHPGYSGEHSKTELWLWILYVAYDTRYKSGRHVSKK